MGSPQCRGGAVDCSPNLLLQLHVFDILREIVQPTKQTERIAER